MTVQRSRYDFLVDILFDLVYHMQLREHTFSWLVFYYLYFILGYY